MNNLTLTPNQKEILLHRLDSGCVADVLFESEVAHLDAAEEAVKAVETHIKAGVLPLGDMTALEVAVVVDCLDGCTFFADSDDAVALKQITRQKVSAWHKAADELEAAVSAVCDRPVYCTRH